MGIALQQAHTALQNTPGQDLSQQVPYLDILISAASDDKQVECEDK
jgi:hypothetical protein